MTDCWHAVVCHIDWRLVVEANQLVFWYAVVAQTLADLNSIIICGVAVEISAVAVHVWQGIHLNQKVHEITFFRIGPLIDLHEDAVLLEVEVQHLQILAQLAVWLQDLAVCIVAHCENTWEAVMAWEAGQDVITIQFH